MKKEKKNVMKLMQKLMKKNNKGFSLVELIVVILIIGVLAVAIAPQVTKWVGTAKTNQGKNEVSLVTSAAQVALSEAQSTSTVSDGTTATIATSGVSCTNTTFDSKLEEVFTDYSKLSKTYTITVTNGGIEVK